MHLPYIDQTQAKAGTEEVWFMQGMEAHQERKTSLFQQPQT